MSAKARRSQDELEKLFSQLETSAKKQGRVLEVSLSKVLNIIEDSQVCTPSRALLLLKCCGDVLVDVERKKRTELAEKCLSLVESIPNSKLDISHYNALLKVINSIKSYYHVDLFCSFFRFIKRIKTTLRFPSLWLRLSRKTFSPTG